VGHIVGGSAPGRSSSGSISRFEADRMKSSIRGSLKTGLGPPALGVGRSRGTLSANWGRRVPIQRVQLHVLVCSRSSPSSKSNTPETRYCSRYM
jgi:hypothetical protein